MSENNIIANNEQYKYYPFSGTYHLVRSSFFLAGQDSFTAPPAQNPDLFQVLQNAETLQGTIKRRRGYSLLTSAFSGNPFQRSYSFRSEALSLRELVFTSPTTVVAIDEAGNTILNPIFTPSAGATSPRMVLSRNYGYFSDGVRSDYKKWDGTPNSGNLTNWGININAASAAFGPNPPVTAGQFGSATGSAIWTSPNNILANDGVVSSATAAQLPFPQISSTNFLTATNFSFALSAGVVITGVQVDIKCNITNSGTHTTHPLNVSLTKASGPVTNVKNVTVSTGSLAFVTLGGPTDLWNTSWSAADVNGANFGATMSAIGSSNLGGATFNIDFVQVTVYTQAPPITVGAPASGGITLASGRTYFYVFKNDSTGARSGLSPASLTTGPLTNNQVPLSTIGVSPDTQVTSVDILATLDGNDQTTLYFLGNVPNGTTTFTDNVPDLTLQTRDILQETDENNFLHGVANNNPPPAGNFPTKHKGRIYMAIGDTLYFSKNLTDVTTSTGLITSKWEEAWPATNIIDLSQNAETVQGIVSDGETLWIGTERAIRRLIGDSPSNFQEPEVQFNETGLLNQDCWKVVFFEGQPVGSMWLTPDLRVIASDFNTYEDVGKPIQDVLNSINPAAISTIHASFVSQGPADYYMLYVPIGSNTTPDTVLVYNLRSKLWTTWHPLATMTTSLFNISSSGNPQWLIASQSGNIFFWDPTQLQDNVGLGAAPYPVTIATSWLNFGDASFKKALNQALITTGDSTLTLSIDGAVTDADLSKPIMSNIGSPVVVNAPVQVGPFGEFFVPLAGLLTKYKWYRMVFTSNGPLVSDVLSAYSIETVPLLRY